LYHYSNISQDINFIKRSKNFLISTRYIQLYNMDYHKMKKLTSELALLATFVILICSGCEDIVDAITGYEEAQAEEEIELSVVTVSVYYSSMQYNNGEPYVTARGKVKNHGPNPIWSIRVSATTNWGVQRIDYSDPLDLGVGEIGDWEVGPLLGTYIKHKEAMYGE